MHLGARANRHRLRKLLEEGQLGQMGLIDVSGVLVQLDQLSQGSNENLWPLLEAIALEEWMTARHDSISAR
jgi:hypothetical protein